MDQAERHQVFTDLLKQETARNLKRVRKQRYAKKEKTNISLGKILSTLWRTIDEGE